VPELLVEVFGVILGALHFSVPLTYYLYLERYAHRPWALKVDKQYQPLITMIVPTYNESQLIEKRLENLAAQDYPTDKREIIVVDSGSTDGTAAIVENWIRKRSDINARLIRESVREGKFRAVTNSIRAVQPSNMVVVLTDADAYWEATALSEAVSFFADPTVGAVTGSISYIDDYGTLNENAYRNYYNFVRVAESKIHSTPVHNGPLLAIRAELVRKIGLPDFPGSDDSAFGSYIAFAGYRAIQADHAIVKEYVRGNRLRRKVRRATCLLLNFHRTRRYAKKMNVYVPSKFDDIWRMEWWLTVANPWLLFASVFSLVGGAMFYQSKISLVLLVIGTLFFCSRPYRGWVLQQLYLVMGALRSLRTNEAVWER
jgi:cellulose synthase/poly-beta-1,6-N-acetylglucosamine synthase-like glycosyltransferase